jgi:hypothetical protein
MGFSKALREWANGHLVHPMSLGNVKVYKQNKKVKGVHLEPKFRLKGHEMQGDWFQDFSRVYLE